MAIPTASVKIELLSLQGVPAATPGPGNTRYARARFSAGKAPPVLTGRSRPIADAGGKFDLTVEAAPWVFEAWVEPGDDVHIDIDLLEDHGDSAPPAALSTSITIADPWTSGTRILPGTPAVELRIGTLQIKPSDAAFLARAAAASGISGTLVAPQGCVVEITAIDGLYQPDPAATAPAPHAKKVAGYISADNLGRIYTNRNAAGDWTNDTQFIDVKVKVTAFGGPPLPASTKVRWTLVDLDDPLNDQPDFHRAWGRYVDANDYDASGAPIGAHPGDNALAHSPGNADEDKVFGAAAKGNARWATAPGGPAPAPLSRNQAESAVLIDKPRLGHSAVRIHCPNVLGTNFAVAVEIIGLPATTPVFNTRSGTMTMWSRIDVEVARMATAHSVSAALDRIPAFFVPACVQLDFRAERIVSGALDKALMAASRNVLTASTRAWVDDAGVFKHRNQGGWFFLGAARLPTSVPPVPPAVLHKGSTYTLGTTGSEAWVELPGSLPTANFVKVTWVDGSGRALDVSFTVDHVDTAVTVGMSRLVLVGNDVVPLFSGHDADGSIPHAYASSMDFFPQHRRSAGASTLSAGGFGVPSAGATFEVFPPGATFVTGISPSVPSRTPPSTGAFFAGRTVLFTHTPSFSQGTPPLPKADFDRRVVSTVVHEFLHAFGMPHKCGHWDWRTPRAKSCCMNYFNTWLLDPALDPLPGTVGKNGDDMCGRHLMEVRRVHLDRNPGLKW